MEAYQNPQNIPAFALDIQVEPQSVDVNVHPTKSEVKFQDERYIMDLLQQVIKREIYKQTAAVEYDTVQHGARSAGTKPQRFVQDVVMTYDEKERVEPVSGSEEFWQLHNTYILAQTKSGLIIVDQHVAHERVIYESIMKGRVQSQRLLFPITIELTPEEHHVYEKTKHTLQGMGIEFKEFSAHTVVIDSLPSGVRTNREEISGLFGELNELGDLIEEKSRIATVVACRGAIKAGQRLSPAEMQALIDRLFATENPYTCPHGRPIVIRLTVEELARKFGRSSPVAH
jgi:DNA mismatch repair protein MutL